MQGIEVRTLGFRQICIGLGPLHQIVLHKIQKVATAVVIQQALLLSGHCHWFVYLYIH